MLIKKLRELRGMFTKKNLPRLVILLIILIVLYFVYNKFLKEGFTNEITSDDVEAMLYMLEDDNKIMVEGNKINII